jgi:hypothetical protein
MFEDMTTGLNPVDFQRLKSELDKASGAAVSLATEHADRRVNDVLGSRQEVLTELCRLRDEFTSLAAEGEQGLLPARDFNERLSRLQREFQAVNRHSNEVDKATELVELIEEDPEGWADATFYEKYPHMQPEFSF